MNRLAVAKTYKLYIGGAFPRSESGRTYEVLSADAKFLANAARASRKDARDAVVAARGGAAKWTSATPYNRGQVLYRIAEVLEGRHAQFADELRAVEGTSIAAAESQVSAAIDLLVWYAGWCDKYQQVAGQANPVAGPYFNLSVSEPTGVVGLVAPQEHRNTLLGLVSTLAPILVSGNSAVVVANERAPLAAVSFCEVLATSDVPAGAVNVLTGSPAEITPWLASHADVNALDLSGAARLDWAEWEAEAAGTLKRVVRPLGWDGFGSTHEEYAQPSLERILAFTETKTVWHTKSLL